MKWNYEGKYMEQFIVSYRGTIGDRFCQAVRAGNEDPRAVLSAVREDVTSRDGEVWQQVAKTLSTEEAWEFAEHILERESLPWEEKQRLKDEAKAETARYAMASKEPTLKQLAYLESLRCPVVPTSRLEASDLISQYKASTPVKSNIDLDSLPF